MNCVNPRMVKAVMEFNVEGAQQRARQQALVGRVNDAQSGRHQRLAARFMYQLAEALAALGHRREQRAPASPPG